MEQLRRELIFRAGKPDAANREDPLYLLHSHYEVVSVFFGGGTPSLVPFSEIKKTMDTIHALYPLRKDAEITIECNPSSTMKLALDCYQRAGINRISFGLQSTNDKELEALGRTHRYHDFLKAYQDARLSGFKNVNIDLMNGIPLQTVESYRRSLKNISLLRPEHLSVYNLIVEPGTRFYRLQEEGRLPLPTEEELLQMDQLTLEWTEKMGMKRYEISNYAKEGFASIHNYNYWSDVDYLGFGLGAASYFQNCRWKNISSFRRYMEVPFSNAQESNTEQILTEERHPLSKEEQMEEFFILGLRRTEGISEMDFVRKFSVDIQKLYGTVLKQLVAEGYLVHKDSRYFFTKEGLDLSNQLLLRFL